MSIKRILRVLLLRLVTHLSMSPKLRLLFAKKGGVKVLGKHVFIGEGVIFDSMYPEEIVLEDWVHITMRCIILTHNLDTRNGKIRSWKKGHVHIGKYSFIGANTIICNSVNIGENVIVGANSVVTKDIPDNEIWAGNPARFIKKRNLNPS